MQHLDNIDFYIVDVSAKHEPVDVLHHCQGSDFEQYPGFEIFKDFGIIPSYHELGTAL